MRIFAALLLVPLACSGPSPAPAPSAPPPAPVTVRLLVDGKETAISSAQVLSVDDANERFQATLSVDGEVDHARPMMLMVGETSLQPSSSGRSGAQSHLVVPLTAPQARALASALGVPVRERAPWQVELGGRLEAPAVAAGAERVPLRFHLTNTGKVPCWFMDGGRGRNALGRDNRFQFVIERDGERLATRRLDDFGGLGVYRRLEPGGTWTFEPDLAHWLKPDRPGQYTVRATYEAELMPADYQPGQTQPPGFHAHLQRTRQVPADLVLTVR